MNNTPAISVIIPFFNAARHLPQALSSVLTQSQPPLEVIAIDDGSTDGSAEIAAALRAKNVRLISQAQQGTAVALNNAIAAAKGDLIAFLDADDYWTSDKLQLQCGILERDSSLDFVLGQMQSFFSPDMPAEARAGIICSKDPIPGYSTGTMLIRRRALDSVGYFHTQWRIGEFLDWYLRARAAGLNYICTNDLVLMRRIHQSNKGRLLKQGREDYLSIIQRARHYKKNQRDSNA